LLSLISRSPLLFTQMPVRPVSVQFCFKNKMVVRSVSFRMIVAALGPVRKPTLLTGWNTGRWSGQLQTSFMTICTATHSQSTRTTTPWPMYFLQPSWTPLATYGLLRCRAATSIFSVRRGAVTLIASVVDFRSLPKLLKLLASLLLFQCPF